MWLKTLWPLVFLCPIGWAPTHKVDRWKQCSFLQSSSQWMLHKCVSPSDASPGGKWLADYLKGIRFWQLQHVKTAHGSGHMLTVYSTKVPCNNRWNIHCFHSELTTEIPTDHIRDDAIWPHSLRSGGGCSPSAMETLSVCSSLTPDTLIGYGTVNCNKCMGNLHWSSSFYLKSLHSQEVDLLIPALIPESVWLVCTVCSLLWASLNMRRSSSSRAISPKKAAGANK